MESIYEFFEPLTTGFNVWILKIIGLYVSLYLIIWIFALILSRKTWFGQEDVYVNTYLGWLMPYTIHTVLSALFLPLLAMHFEDLDISWTYCVPFLFMIIISGFTSLNLSSKIKSRLKVRREQS